MHQLFRLVLGQKDLSRAGDLFSLDDSEIEDSLTEALEQIKIISSSSDYQTNNNDQAVVEICITRITTAIRETESIEKHAKALVGLWDSCLEHHLRPSGKDEDTPHAKIASDIMSCILQNYNRPPVMALAIPVAVKFLHRGNKELCRNMSNYLSLAAITKADLLVDHTEVIVKSILQGNATLLRVLPAVYDKQPQPINKHLTELLALMYQLEQPEQYHLLRLLHVAAKRKQLEVVQKCIPFLIGHLKNSMHNDVILSILIEIAGYEPVALNSFLPVLKEIGERFPYLIGQMARIYGTVGRVDEERARSCLPFLVSQLANMEHSFHHILLLEIKSITDTFSSILGPQSRDIFRMSNSFTAIAKLLTRQLETAMARSDRRKTSNEIEFLEELEETKFTVDENEDHEKLQVKIQAFEDKITAENNTPGSIRRYSLDQVSKEGRKDIRFNRSKSLALHTVLTSALSSEDGDAVESADTPASISLSEIDPLGQGRDRSPFKADADGSQLVNSSVSHPSIMHIESENLPEMVKENHQEETPETTTSSVEYHDKLYLYLKENLSKVKAYALEIRKKIPVPDQCTIEDSVQSCVAKLFFSCSLKGHYCLYSKSSFILISQEPQPWIQIMFLFQQSLFPEPLSIQSRSVQFLRALWEKTQAEGAHSFETAMMESTFPQQKDLDQVQLHLEEVRFFDVFGFSEAAGAWQCFMCNNPERATVVNQDGQPLIEGKLKEKQVRWKFIKRWKTRYFTLAGNQLLFQKGKSFPRPLWGLSGEVTLDSLPVGATLGGQRSRGRTPGLKGLVGAHWMGVVTSGRRRTLREASQNPAVTGISVAPRTLVSLTPVPAALGVRAAR
ncbi:ventricular zone-expressed PH domain-containing protein homolog 1 isoform X1 [Sus scrofa]|uniref:ventricular zone-expressed PH domain-containing protein homolog 1 isoform X1 n=1 Tax=Sus scrofa TaxID=9823 RepID=UPI000A2B68DB|nr:ventricular zone-expressed PH domain-containing protein homolog 1 isoform X1 [Sus scrofa]XP_020925369.1 ventricular zone-expressed PH domain-containing protein homolog 1 isoform X1 [Sus scrofa]XP_020925370.1 ventricular zone-expressed PH domain-containing protein homolog 1 isoform X1 [Sus scrofa]XP_020925371.1 ventricular zone-expressed PH domain-containing protein homolog 1 isoform X1 [Sus scrofa]XP_020925372.1 ventricular zone-expressed PH domain-containing protein homolog 1 isoform X1 [Su